MEELAVTDKPTIRAVRKPLTPEGARLVLENPHAGWDAATRRDARRVMQRGNEPQQFLTEAERAHAALRIGESFAVMTAREERALGRWMGVWTILGLAIVAAVAWWAVPARGHEAPAGWSYDPACCSDYDCAPIPASAVSLAPDGWRLRLAPGQHPFVRAPLDAVVPFGDHRLRRSGDGGWHACISPTTGRVLCVYEPDRLG
jgi:hypothetical protein